MSHAEVHIRAQATAHQAMILSREALEFIAELHGEVEPRRVALLASRGERAARLAAGERFDFPSATAALRASEWKVAPVPKDLADRKVEITGPTDRKMVINALNSGASTYMADFEDANTPTWENLVEGQANLIDAIDRSITLTNPDGRVYKLLEETATLLVRPRGWHLVEKHVKVDGGLMSGAVFDFGLYVFHNARRLVERGTGPYFYLPKLESALEARLWRDIFVWTEERLGLARGTIKATVLVECIPLAFEMDETLHELRDHSGGLNAGRWDYIFSLIKKLNHRADVVLPDRPQVTMTVPFMRAYTELLVRTCHRRGAYALGGMAAFIPNRRDPKVTEIALAKVREDKSREANDGFDGTWVAHPDLVETAMAEFDKVLGASPHQLHKLREDVNVTAAQIQDIHVPGGTITEAGLRMNVSVGIQYLASWLRGTGAAAINDLMEDAATAEISRSQVWQWIAHGASLAEGPRVTAELAKRIAGEELAKIRERAGSTYTSGRYEEAREIFEAVALSREFREFLTIPAYERIP